MKNKKNYVFKFVDDNQLQNEDFEIVVKAKESEERTKAIIKNAILEWLKSDSVMDKWSFISQALEDNNIEWEYADVNYIEW